jgi:tetratricopeptide (TPR) repeat protein
VLSDSYFGRIQVRRASFFVTAVLSGEEAAREARALIESDLAAIERIGIKPHVALCGRALPLIIEGKNEEALDLIDRAIRIDGAFAEGYSSRASLRLLMSGTALGALRTALLESALKDFTKALLISGEDTDFRIGRVEVLTQLKRWKEALAEADALVIVLHDTPFSYLQRAQVRMALGDEAGFEEDMKRAEELPFPTPEMHLAATGIILGGHKFNGLGIIKTKEIERALRHLDQLIRKCPERRDIQGIRGMLLMLLGRRAEALAAFQGYLQEYPKAKIAATVFLLQSVLRTGIDLSNDAPFLPFFQAGQRLQRGEAAEAEGLYREALRRLEAPHGPLPPAERASRENIARSGRVTLARLVVKRAAAEGGGAAKGAWLEEALELLDRAVALGYADLKSIDEDPAWAPLRALPGFGPKREAWGRQGK